MSSTRFTSCLASRLACCLASRLACCLASRLACALLLVADLGSAHDLGFSSAELRFVDGRVQLELVTDAPDAETRTLVERRTALVEGLQGGVTVEIDGNDLPLTPRVVALGEGRSAVDVVEFRASAPATLGELRVGFASGLGDVALEVRAPSGQSLFRRLLVDGARTPAIALQSAPPPPDSPFDGGAAAQGDLVAPVAQPPQRLKPNDAVASDSSRGQPSMGGPIWLALLGVGALAVGVWVFLRRPTQG